MSVQTHSSASANPHPGRLRARIERALRDPNPIWIRELKQSARLTRTPIVLAVLTGMMTLLIASIGGVLSTTAEPAQVGIGVFHTFFSLAFVVVSWLGPAVAAATIASERSGRTWEALLLTGMPIPAIARGKFLSSLTYIGLYVVMLAPVGGLSFLFGGVTPIEVLLAFALLMLIAGLSVAFGLAMSSILQSPAVSILVTLVVAVPISILVYSAGGVGLSYAVRELFPGLSAGPVWLPGALVRADFGLPYFVFLVLCPVVSAALPAWLFYEVTIANMAAPSDDRSTRLRIWLLASGPLLTGSVALSGLALKKVDWFVAGLGVCWLFFGFAAFLCAGEPLGPSHRVEVHWARQHRSAMLRALGPGVARAAALAWGLAALCLGSLVLLGILYATSRDERWTLFSLGGYALGFTTFCLGFGTWSRSRSNGAAVPRVLLLGVLFLATLGPYIAMAIGGILSDSTARLRLLAAPSPAFIFAVLTELHSPGGDADWFVLAGASAALGWAVLGLGLWLRGAFQASARLKQQRSATILPATTLVAAGAPSASPAPAPRAGSPPTTL